MKVLKDNSLTYPQIAEVLRSGRIICYPTETFYGLGVDPWNREACERLYQLKQRSVDKALPLIAADQAMVAKICDVSDSRFAILAKNFWPGPLTLVLPALDHSITYAVRVSSNPIACKISEEFGKPIVSTSANKSSQPPAQNPGELDPDLIPAIEILLDGGMCKGGLPSTIVLLIQPKTEIVREGAIPSNQIFSLL